MPRWRETMTDDIVARYCRLVVEGANDASLLEIATQMSADEKMRAFARLIEEADIKACMEALAAWRALGGKWLHS